MASLSQPHSKGIQHAIQKQLSTREWRAGHGSAERLCAWAVVPSFFPLPLILCLALKPDWSTLARVVQVFLGPSPLLQAYDRHFSHPCVFSVAILPQRSLPLTSTSTSFWNWMASELLILLLKILVYFSSLLFTASPLPIHVKFIQ